MKQPPVAVYLLCLLHAMLGIGAFAAGASLMIVPGGTLLAMKTSWLQHTPFANYFIPGMLLFLLNGLFPFVMLFGLLFKVDWKIFDTFNIYKDKHGAWSYSLISGITVLIWTLMLQLISSYFWIQPLAAVMGICIIIITVIPSVMKYYSVK